METINMGNLINLERVEKLVQHILNTATRGDALSVIKAIDDFPGQRMMNLGEEKSLVMEKVFSERKPKIVAELGGYFGYSALRLAFAARKHNPAAHYYSVELNPLLACVIESLVRFAGMSDAITVLTGDLTRNVSTLKAQIKKRFTDADHLDFLLLDHWKEAYVSDFQLAEKEGLLKQGSVVVADNIIFPGAPKYRKYMEAETVRYSSTLQRIGRDAIMISIVN